MELRVTRIALSVVVLALATWSTPNAVGQTVQFAAPVSYTLRENPESICAGDFDGDGDHDLAVAGDSSAGIVILANDGNGGMTTLRRVSATAEIERLISVDIDGDGDRDLITANGDANSVSVFLNDGTARFGAPINVGGLGQRVIAVTATDFDRDGRLDLAAANRDSNTVSVIRNTGTGFVRVATLSTIGEPRDVIAADLDLDGWPDLVAPDKSRNGVVWFRNVAGTFSSAAFVSTGSSTSPEAICVADLNGDGFLDLIAGDDNRGALVLTNLGNAAFASPVRVPTSSEPERLIAGDLDGDADIDIVAVGEDANVIDVLLNDGTGRLTRISTATGAGPHDVVAVDLDGDGDLDLATPNESGSSASVVKNLTTNAAPIATLRPVGPVSTGSATSLLINTPHDGPARYVVAYSTALSPQIPIPGGRNIPLGPSPLLALSLSTPAPLFTDTTGHLSSSGTGYTRVVIPNLGALKGTKLHGAFALIDPLHPGGFGSVSAARTLYIR